MSLSSFPQNNYNVLMGLDPSDVQGFNHDQGGPGRNGGHARNNAADSHEPGGGEEQQKAEALAGWVVQDKRQKGRLDKPPVQHKPHPQPHAPTAAVRIHDVQFPDEEYEQFPDEQFPNEQFPDEQYPPNVEDYGETEAEMQFRLFSEVEHAYPQIPAPQPPFSSSSRPAPQPSFPTHTLPVQSSPAQPSSHAVSTAVHGSNGFHGGVNLGGVDRMTGRQDTPEERAWHSMGEEEQLRFLAAQQDDWNGPGGAPQQGDGWTLLDHAPDNTTTTTSGQHQAQRATATTTTAPLTAANLLLAQQQQERAAMVGRPEARSAAQAAPVYAPRVIPLQQVQQERGPPVVIQAFPTSHAALVLQQQQLEQLAEQQFQQQQVQQVSLLQVGVVLIKTTCVLIRVA